MELLQVGEERTDLTHLVTSVLPVGSIVLQLPNPTVQSFAPVKDGKCEQFINSISQADTVELYFLYEHTTYSIRWKQTFVCVAPLANALMLRFPVLHITPALVRASGFKICVSTET